MTNSFKKWITIPLMVSALSAATLLPAKRAEAIVGLATANPAAALLGLALWGGGGGAALYGLMREDNTGDGLFYGGFIGVIAGIVLLDGKNSQDIAFSPISSDEAKSIGLTDAELSAYNNELDKINLVRENVESQVSGNSNESVQDASKLWDKYRSDLSPEAFSAAQKVAKAAAQSMNKSK